MTPSSKVHSNGAISYNPTTLDGQPILITSPQNQNQNGHSGGSLSRRGTASKLRDKMRLRKSTYETPLPQPAPSLPPTLSLSFQSTPPNHSDPITTDSPRVAPPSPSRNSSLPLPPSSPPPLLPTNGNNKSKTRPSSPPSTKGMTPAAIVAMQAMQSNNSSSPEKRKLKKDPSLATPQEKLESLRNAKLNIEMVNRVIELCGSEIRMRGLATIGIFRPFRFSESQPKQTALIQLLLLTLDPAKYDTVFTLDEACGRTPSTSKSSSHMSNLDPNNSSSLGMSFTAPDSPAKELSNALNKANIHDVIALLKWSLRHTRLTFKDFNSKTSFDWYDEFVSKESRNQYPTNSFSKFLLSKLPETTSIYLNSILSLLTTIGSHHSSNAMPCPRLCGILGFWILGRIGKESPSWNLNDSLKDWEKSKNSLNHLCLAFIREMENEKGVISIPTKLKELIDGYPYFGATRTQNSSPDESITQESKVDNEGTRTTTPTIQAPTFPLAFSPPPQRALRINLRSQNLVISSKRPRAPSETLRAAFGVASINEQNPETSSLTQEETVWKFIVEEGRKAEDTSKAPRKRELSRGGTSDSSSPVPPLPSTPNTFHSTNSLSSISSANPTPAQEEERERIRDEAREKTIVLEDHARILKLVGKSLRERRKLNEELEKEKEKKEKNDQNSTTTNGSANVSGLGSPYSSAKGLDKMAEPNSGSPEIDLTPGSESTFLSSPGSRPSPFSRSVTEFGTFSSPSSTNNTSSMRRCTSQNASTILDGAPELDTLPEDGQSSSYTWLDGFSKTEASPDLSFSTVTLPTSNSSSTPDSFATSPRPRRQSSFGSIKRRSIRSPNHSNLKNLFEPLPDSLPPPPPSFQISSVEIFSFDEAFQNTWQDCLLEGAMPPFVLIGLKDSLLVKATEMLDSKKLDLIRKEKINYLLVDEVATPPLPKSKPSQQASSIDGQSTSRRSFAPSIRSLSASIRRMTGSWRRSKKEV